MVLITLTHVSKSFGSRRVLCGVTLEVHTAEILLIMGPSGCGKTTLLRIMAGELLPDHGAVKFGPFDKAKIEFILQRLNVFPWLTVGENIGFGLKDDYKIRARKIKEMVTLLGLASSEDYYPAQLSGGGHVAACCHWSDTCSRATNHSYGRALYGPGLCPTERIASGRSRPSPAHGRVNCSGDS